MLKAVIKNSSYLLMAQISTKILSFFYTLFLAKQLGVVEFGNYSVALSYFAVLSAIVDLGITRYLVREVVRDSSKFGLIFVNSLVIRLVFSVGLVATFGLVLFSMDPDKTRAWLSIIAAFTIIPQAIGLTFDAALIVKNRFKYSGLGILLLNISTILIGIWFLTTEPNALKALLAVVIGHVLYMLGMVFLVLKSTNDLTNFFKKIKKETLREVLKGSVLYGVMSMLGLVYFKVDTLMLSYLKGSVDAGVYSVAYRFLEGIVFIPAAFETAFFPAISRMHAENKFNLYLYFKSVGLLILLSLPFILSFWFLVPLIIQNYLQTSYSQSIEIIKILALAIPFIFALAAQGAVLLSSEKYLKVLLGVSLFNLIVNVVGNLIFIPSNGVMAAAWMTVISQFLAFLIYFFIIYFGFGKQKNG